MDDIETVTLEQFRNNMKAYKGKKVKLLDYPVFLNDNCVHVDYHIEVGPRGGTTVKYASKGSCNVPSKAFTESGEGDVKTAEKHGWYIKERVYFPAAKSLPAYLVRAEKAARKNLKQYEKTFLRAKKRVELLEQLNEQYPEYSL